VFSTEDDLSILGSYDEMYILCEQSSTQSQSIYGCFHSRADQL